MKTKVLLGLVSAIAAGVLGVLNHHDAGGSDQAAAATTAPRHSAHGLRRVHSPGHVTIDVTLSPGQCHARTRSAAEGEVLPDTSCTPGAIDPAVTQANIKSTICVSGYTDGIRPPVSETDKFKAVAYRAYGITPHKNIELDHQVPLSLGGANSASNLWPEPNRAGAPSTTNPKDSVEHHLHSEVCNGDMTLAQAQQVFATDWTKEQTR